MSEVSRYAYKILATSLAAATGSVLAQDKAAGTESRKKGEAPMVKQAMTRVRRVAVRGVAALGLTAGLLAASLSLASTATAAEPVEAATLVEVDRPGTTMISAAPFNVGKYGYVEREFFASGKAHRYLKADGTVFRGSDRRSDVPLVQGEIAGDYTTRTVVRQPSPRIFNGTLVVEWTNVTTGQDGEFVFGESYNTLLNEGYAVAVVSVQKMGVDNLVATRPERYGDLEVEPEDCADICPRDSMAWDIIAQVSKALKESPDSPFANLGIEKVILTGQSQSAATTSAYYNLFHPMHQVFDGFVFWDGAVPLRTDIGTPAIALGSWTFNNGGAVRVTGDHTRMWEINGAAHGSAFVHEYMDAVFTRDGTQPNGQSFTDWHLGIGHCASTQVGTKVHVGQVIGGAIASVDKWMRTGQPASPSANFERNSDLTLAFDDRGFVIGGVQIADAAVPTIRYEHNTGGWTCPAAGAWADYTLQELEQMYVSHAAYVDQVIAVTKAALAKGHIVKSDARLTIKQAVKSKIAETDISLTGTADVTPGRGITLSVTPKLERGAWLEYAGSKVPVTITGKAYYVEEHAHHVKDHARRAPARPLGELVWVRNIDIRDLSQVNAGVLTLPKKLTQRNKKGSVNVFWCIDEALQNNEFPGHVNETCTSGDLPTLTIKVER